MKGIKNKVLIFTSVLFLLSGSMYGYSLLQEWFEGNARIVSEKEAIVNFGISRPAALVRTAEKFKIDESRIKEVKNLAIEIANIDNEKLIEDRVKVGEKSMSFLLLAIKEADLEGTISRYGESLKSDPNKQEKTSVARRFLEKEIALLPQLIEAKENLRIAKINNDQSAIAKQNKIIIEVTDKMYVETEKGTDGQLFEGSILSVFATPVK